MSESVFTKEPPKEKEGSAAPLQKWIEKTKARRHSESRTRDLSHPKLESYH